MNVREFPLTNSAYGFPTRGHARRIEPPILAVVHITGNAGNQGPNAAVAERNFANRIDSPGPSAHYYVNRDGSCVHAINEVHFAAWSNGDLDQPNDDLGGIDKMLAIVRKGYNANEACYLEIECVGTATGAGQWTDAQYDTVAALIADAADVTGMEISRDTILTHADINSVDRVNCAFLKAHREDDLARLIALARGNADVKPKPITNTTPKLVSTAPGATWYALDGSPLPGTHSGLVDFPSPYGVGLFRAILAGQPDGTAIAVLVRPTHVADVPAPAPVPDPAADAKGFARARDAASEIAATAAAEIAALLP